MALVAFAICLIAGMGADNTFATTVQRALVAMAATLVLGLVVGAMGQKMMSENVGKAKSVEGLSPDAKNMEIPEAKSGGKDR